MLPPELAQYVPLLIAAAVGYFLRHYFGIPAQPATPATPAVPNTPAPINPVSIVDELKALLLLLLQRQNANPLAPLSPPGTPAGAEIPKTAGTVTVQTPSGHTVTV